jgi:glycosyltransferase involved in cell wall biosynthesis
LLFVGTNWYNKGGFIAVQVAAKLNNAGLDTELSVVGCRPPEPLPSFVKIYGYINKSTKEASRKMDALFSESHFLILPTRRDCTPNVIPEANSFGVPCVTSDVGGIPTMVKDEVNGRAFPKDACAEDYSRYILQLFQSKAQYRTLALSAFTEYETRFDWAINTHLVRNFLHELVG